MLTRVSESINKSVRQVVLRHPNSFACSVHRKHVTRVENIEGGSTPSTMGGSPTLGGMGVLKSEDESDFEYVQLGLGRMLFCGQYTPTSLNERDDMPLPENTREAQVESMVDGEFVADMGDLVLLEMGLGVVLAYTVEGVIGGVAIPPYTRKLVLSPRDDLHALEPFLSSL